MDSNAPAYPCQPLDGQGNPLCEALCGMTKLEVASIAAMQGLCGQIPHDTRYFHELCSGLSDGSSTVRAAVTLAKALLSELAKETAQP